MAITRTQLIDDDGSGTTGTVLNNAERQVMYDQIDAALVPLATPVWINVPFSAANFSGTAPMTWTVGSAAIVRNKYAVSGKIMFWSFYLSWFSGSNVLAGSPSASISMKIPGGYTTPGTQKQIIDYCAGIAGVAGTAGVMADIGNNAITISKSVGGNFVLADIPGMIATIVFEVD